MKTNILGDSDSEMRNFQIFFSLIRYEDNVNLNVLYQNI